MRPRFSLDEWTSGSLSARLLAGFSLTVLTALFFALLALAALIGAAGVLDQEAEARHHIVVTTNELELAAEGLNDAIQAYLLSDDERYLTAMATERRRFEAALERLREATLEGGEARYEAIESVYERFAESAAGQVALVQQKWPRAATWLWRTEGHAARNELLQAIHDYRAWHDEVLEPALDFARQQAQVGLWVALSLVVLAAGAGLFLGWRLARELGRRLGLLAVTAQAIEADDLSARARVQGRDEVAQLAAAMNRMVAHLEASREALDASRRELAEAYEKYRVLSENALDVVYSIDAEGRYSYVNAAIERLAGYRPEELVGRHFAEVLPQELRESRAASFQRRMAGLPEPTVAEIEYCTKDGRRVPLELRLSALIRNGTIVGMQGIARDITQRKAMEAQIRALAEQEHRRAEQLQTVARLGREITQLASLDELLGRVASLLHESFQYERVAIFLVDAETHRAALRAWAGEFAAPVPLVLSLAEHQGIVGFVAALGESLRVGDVRAEPRYVDHPAAAGTLSELAVPIRDGERVLGVVDVQGTRHDDFDAADEAALAILADVVSTAILNARLFEQQHNLAVAEERNRLAREIHDTLAQGLTAIVLQLEVADVLLEDGPPRVREKIAKALTLARSNLEEARRSVMDLRAGPLQEKSLPAALEELVAEFGREHGVRAEFGARDVTVRLPAAVEAGLYRIAQEALTNVGKYAKPHSVRVTLEARDGELRLDVEDDGVGFDPDAPRDRRKGGFGLIGMQERAKLLGGTFEVDSGPGRGTRVEVVVPLGPRRVPVAAGATRGET